MVSHWKAALARLYFFCVRMVDSISGYFGVKIMPVTYDSVFSGLNAEEIAEAHEPSIAQPVKLYIEAFQKDQQLDAIGRFTQIQQIKNTLRRRVAIRQSLQEHPAVAETPIKRPVFIIGFPRTGTTMLYNLLAQDPAFKAPMFWEMIAPYPPGRPDNWRECDRFQEVNTMLEFRKMMGFGSFDVAHELRADHPEECQFALGRNFLQYFHHVRLPTFNKVEDWYFSLSREELAEAYKYYKQQLQMIGYKGLDKHGLLLKSHNHLLSLDALLDAFPDACLIFTYRKMTEVIPSFCSTISKGTAGWGDIDAGFGKRVLRLVSEFANRGVETMKKYENVPKEEQPFYNVEYSQMVADPIGIIRGIYEQYGLNFTKEAEDRMHAWIANNPQHKHGKHRYSMEEYGLKAEDITDSMGPYLDYFKDKSDNLV